MRCNINYCFYFILMENSAKLKVNDEILTKNCHNNIQVSATNSKNNASASHKKLSKISSKCRTQLWYIVFFGFAIDFMSRININIAIVDMIASKNVANLNNTINDYECYTVLEDTKEFSNLSSNEKKYGFSLERYMLDFFKVETIVRLKKKQILISNHFFCCIKIPYNKNGFEWNENKQSQILGSFFWLHALTQIPGGILSKKYGTKLIFGYSILISSLTNIFIPIFSYIDIRLILLLRIFQGFIMVGIENYQET